jgi:hypothetical protein
MWSVLNVPTMCYFNCPRQRGMFLLFLQCGILTVLAVCYISCLRLPDNVECSYCSYIVVF